MGLKPKATVSGPSQEELARQAAADAKAKAAEDSANAKLSSTQAASVKSRTGRRLLFAPGREDQVSSLSGSTQSYSA